MKRKLFLCCNKDDIQKYSEKVKRALGRSTKIVDAMEQADLVYAIGEISPEMQKQMEQAKAAGIKTVHVNENLINEEVYQRTLNFKGRDADRGR